ncbi:MAG: hydrogenase formation protein HypD [Candidatus Micrarchaeota archaeon]|nr:hydrogenase formation protein HypD [Candidatus Micrarchaeota archaeon]
MSVTRDVLSEIREIAKGMPQVNIMEVCGTHTQTIAMHGIREAMPENINLISGPGCPVCVTHQRDLDNIIELALNGVKIATYGDMLRIPGSRMRLDEVRTIKNNVKAIYSIKEIIGTDYVFFGAGFETTAPMTAYALQKGVVVYSVHKLIPPVLKVLTQSGEIRIDGFIGPGHVSTIIGSNAYEGLNIPLVISGFEREDVLLSVLMLLKQIKEGRTEVENEYTRVVTPEGNTSAQKILEENFIVTDAEWRGFGTIPDSGLEPKNKELDAKVIYKDILKNVPEPSYPKGCICDRIIRGLNLPSDCPLFKGGKCNPIEPIGPCMVSVEGACNVWFRNKR